MQWIRDIGLFLFDFDGLLVDTEKLHFQAYQQMCAINSSTLPWDFEEYCLRAHYGTEVLRMNIDTSVPNLHNEGKDWEQLYEEKVEIYRHLLEKAEISLMPGVSQFLERIASEKIPSCIVTHSKRTSVEQIISRHPVLQYIPFWITREDYHLSKPNPECYLKAISLYGNPLKKTMGFEDSPRGVEALLQTKAVPVLVTRIPYPEIPTFRKKGVQQISSFETIFEGGILAAPN